MESVTFWMAYETDVFEGNDLIGNFNSPCRANRAVHCVNACADIPNPEVLPDVISFLRYLTASPAHSERAQQLLTILEVTLD